MRLIRRVLTAAFLILVASFFVNLYIKQSAETKILKRIITRLEADTRVAEIVVTGVNYDENTKKTYTTIKFLEYDTENRPLIPKYFTFSGNIIQFQSLVIRFNDINIRRADRLKDKSAYLFWKVFMLDGKDTQEYEITKIYEIPGGYKLQDTENHFERRLWNRFWEYALNPKEKDKLGIKNAQIEAPGTMFMPGMIYTIKIEHDGGLRIDTSAIPQVLRGEKIPE